MSEKVIAVAKGFKVIISSPFGATEGFRNGTAHTGIDIPLEANTVLQSIADGVVTKVYDGTAAIGKGVSIKTEDGTTHIFGHLNQTSVEIGDKISTGDIIGLSGNTGNVVGANGGYHLHFATKNPDGTFTDPTHLADEIGTMITEKGEGNWILEKYNAFADWFIGKETEILFKPAGNGIKGIALDCWHWFTANLPDIIGYFTLAAGAFIILTSLIGNGGMMKTLGWYLGALILAVCILGGV